MRPDATAARRGGAVSGVARVGPLILLIAIASARGAAALPANAEEPARTGVELAAAREGAPSPYSFTIAPAAGGDTIGTARGFGFVATPAGEHIVRIAWAYGEPEVEYARIRVTAGATQRVVVDTGIEFSGPPGRDAAPYTWSVEELASGEAVALAKQRAGFLPLPAGEYAIQVAWHYGETPTLAGRGTVVAGQVLAVRADTGVELVPGAEGMRAPYSFSVFDPATEAVITTAKQRYGLVTLPPGEVAVRVEWVYGETAVPFARETVAAGELRRIAIDRGLELAPGPADSAAPFTWTVRDAATGETVTVARQRYGIVPLPPGEYTIALGWVYDEKEVPYARAAVGTVGFSRIDVDTGVELAPAPGRDAPYKWSIRDAVTDGLVTIAKQRYGFVPLPAGEYTVRITWVYDESEGAPARVSVAPGQVTRIATFSGVELVAGEEGMGAPYTWRVLEPATGVEVAAAKRRYGVVETPPGELSLRIGWAYDEREVDWARTTVAAGEVRRVALDTGLELLSPGEGAEAPYAWRIRDAASGAEVTTAKLRYGFVPLPAGEYALGIVARYDEPEVHAARVRVEAGGILRVPLDTGIELAPPIAGAAPPREWRVARAGETLAIVRGRWGAVHLPPGEYAVTVADAGGALGEPIAVVVEAGRLVRIGGGGAAGPEPGIVEVRSGDTMNELRWSPPAGAAVVGYRVYRQGRERPVHGPALLTTARFADIGLSNGRTYIYIVAAVLADGTEWRGYGEASGTPGARP